MGLSRVALLAWLALAAVAAEGHRFVVKEPKVEYYERVQTVGWRSAGDDLSYRTHLEWQFALVPLEVTAERAVVEARILNLAASHTGPGSDHHVDSHDDQGRTVGADDPLLGNLLVLVNVPLQLTLDPRSGEVSAVEGQERIVERLEEAHPGPGGRPSPIAEQAAAAYAPDRLARLWSRLLMVPREGAETVPLEAPLIGRVERTWRGDGYELGLAEGQEPPTAVLATRPGRIELRLTDLTGSGGATLRDGVLTRAEGTLEAAFAGLVLGQDVEQRHRIEWQLGRIELQAGETADPPDDGDASPVEDGTEGDERDTGPDP